MIELTLLLLIAVAGTGWRAHKHVRAADACRAQRWTELGAVTQAVDMSDEQLSLLADINGDGWPETLKYIRGLGEYKVEEWV